MCPQLCARAKSPCRLWLQMWVLQCNSAFGLMQCFSTVWLRPHVGSPGMSHLGLKKNLISLNINMLQVSSVFSGCGKQNVYGFPRNVGRENEVPGQNRLGITVLVCVRLGLHQMLQCYVQLHSKKYFEKIGVFCCNGFHAAVSGVVPLQFH